ncbi:PREDICTED: formin-like protein 3 [Ipomoea nil]|uniref:formin-like protein 3 n=1 Tax=Ipomoea nil TaxID=35883 RepID=UPI0009012693|nr:PREDICTED: formin-like protein 3 [Ipomoea nil]
MAISTPPPPPNPSSSASAAPATAATATTTTTTRPLYSNSRPPVTAQPHPFPPQPQRFSSNQTPIYSQLAPRPPHSDPSTAPPPPPPQPQPQHHSILYPVASSGRGFLSRPAAPTPNQTNYLARPAVGYSSSIPPFGISSAHMDPGLGQGLGFSRPTNLPHAHLASAAHANSTANAAPLMPVVVKGVPVTSAHPKLAPPLPSFSDFSGSKDGRDRSKDDSFAIVRERKVKLSDTASLYALCRSWLRNGFPEATQPQYMDVVKSLPRPLPMAPQDAESPAKKEEDKGEEEEDDVSVEHLSTEKLLQIHVKRAKRIRSKLREERLRRIARYKTRLALLLPPMGGDQQFRNDSTSGN